MGDAVVDTTQETSRPAAVAAPAPTGRPADTADLGTGPVPARVLALQRAAGNRAVARSLRPPARPARRALARRKSLSDRVSDLRMEIGQAAKPIPKELTDRGVALGKEAWALVVSLKGGSDDVALDSARDDVKQVVRALITGEAFDAAIDFARTTDADVQSVALNSIRNHVSGVAGQQHGLTKFARLAGTTAIPAATASQKSADWLEKQTEAAGAAFGKLESMGLTGFKSKPLSLELAQELMKEYFTTSPADVKPDPLGKIGKLAADATSKQLEADCDVYASYAARLLRAAGWTTVGYLAIVPDESTGRDAHAVALVKRTASGGGTEYAGVSNSQTDVLTASSDDAARDPLLDLALDIYRDPKPNAWKAYYSPATAGGGFDLKLLDPVNKGLSPFRTKAP